MSGTLSITVVLMEYSLEQHHYADVCFSGETLVVELEKRFELITTLLVYAHSN